MNKNGKLLKYEVINTKKDKKLIGEVFDFKKVKAKGGPTKKSRAKAPAWFVEFEKRNNQRFDRIESNVSDLRNDLNRVIKLNNLKH